MHIKNVIIIWKRNIQKLFLHDFHLCLWRFWQNESSKCDKIEILFGEMFEKYLLIFEYETIFFMTCLV